jgi:signal transduction histidine kinase
VSAVIVTGLGAAVWLLAGFDPRHWDPWAALLFGALGVLTTVLSVSYQGFLPSTIVHQTGTSFAYALFLVADTGVTCCVLALMNISDWLVNRRRPLTSLFNVGQLSLSLWAAVLVRSLVRPGFRVLDGVDARTMAAAFASLLVFFLVNHSLTHVVVSLASRSPLLRLDLGTRSGVLNEAACIVSGLSMAVLWWVRPWLSLLGVLPVWLTTILLVLLSRREKDLENREAEVRSLQDLGLEIGAELNVERLGRSVVRVASQALQSSGALLAVLREGEGRLRVLSTLGIPHEPPATIAKDELGPGFFDKDAVVRFAEARALPGEERGLRSLEASGFLAAPLRIRDRREGALILFHGAGRRPFDDEDERRLETLIRFVDVALSNAQLVAELQQIHTQLLQTEKMSELGMLVSGVAHELNNPLTSVVGYTQLLMSRDPDAERGRMLNKVASEAARAARIVQNLLSFSRKRETEKRPTDINTVLEQVLDLRAYELRVGNVELVRRLDPELRDVVADPHRLQQVFLNLLTNAEHAVRRVARPGRITVETRAHDDVVRIVVTDNGHGISRENLEKVFLPFFTTKEAGEGTGLGLPICAGIVQEHGGRIAVDSREGEGTSFTVEIPASPIADAPRERAAAPRVPAPRTLPGGHLLVVDDEEPIADLVRDALEDRGWTVRSARDGAEALSMVALAPFDVLLVDMKMPGMDGREFYEMLRRSHPEMARRVVFSTGDVSSVGTSQFLDSADNPVLGKPYDLDSLIETVQRVAGAPPPAP